VRAIVQDAYGDSEVLRVDDLPIPEPGEGEVRVAVRAAGVNMADWHLMTGRPLLVHAFAGMRAPKRRVRGQDVAGVIDAVGSGVTSFVVGDEVFGEANGSFAEFVVTGIEQLVFKPANVSFEQAAAIPMGGYTALQALQTAEDVAGVRVVVTGAGGGVGSALVQLAHARGAQVTAVCSAGKADFARSLGADEVVDYASADVTVGEPRFDVVFDFAGGRRVSDWRRVIVPGGALVLGGDENGGAILGPLGRSLTGLIPRGIRVITLMANAKPDDLSELARLVADGTLKATVARSYRLEDTATAIDDLRAARYPGKLVVVP
jgi:NADPH:quinone reductase-like Zn-dependent oxidoreductase